MSTPPAGTPAHARRLSVVGFAVLVVVYLVVLQGIPRLLTQGLEIEYGSPQSIDELWRSLTVAVAAGLLFVCVLISYLRWWRPVTVDDRPVQRWVVIVPLIMVVTILAVTDYGNLGEKGLTFTLLLLLTALFVGFGEELMFRGVGVTTFRTNGFTEGKVALWSTLAFGLAHATNLFSEGLTALPQVVATIITGYFFYLTRRRFGTILVPALLHGFWDFALISNLVTGETPVRATLALPVMVVIGLILLVRRRHIEPVTAGA